MFPARDATASLSIIKFDLFYPQIIIIIIIILYISLNAIAYFISNQFKFFTDKKVVESKHWTSRHYNSKTQRTD